MTVENVDQISGFNHIGVGVGDIDAGITFYRDVLGCRILRGPFEVTADGPEGEEAVDVLGTRPFNRMRMAHLATPDDVGIELFQLIDPPHERREPELEYWKSGTFHFCLTAPDIDATLANILRHGGKQLSRSWPRHPDDPAKRMVYCLDPWGTVIELYTHSFTSMYS